MPRLPFIPNRGQYSEEVLFYTPIAGGAVFVTRRGDLVYSLMKPRGKTSHDGATPFPDSRPPFPDSRPPFQENRPPSPENRPPSLEGWALKEIPVREKTSLPCGREVSPVRVSCFKGSDPTRWRKDLAAIETIDLGEISEGVVLRLHARSHGVEKVFHVHPGGAPETIRIRMRGAREMKVDGDGALVVDTALGPASFTPPVAYQMKGSRKEIIPAAYTVQGDMYGFRVGAYDRGKELIIDPLLASTFLGGSGGEGLWGCPTLLRDKEGCLYVAGYTASSDFPVTPGAYCEGDLGGWDIFVAKIDSDLRTLLAATYLGGSGKDWGFRGIILTFGEGGSLYVAGQTGSVDFPVTPGAYDPSHNGQDDVFLARLTADLTDLEACTYLGSPGEELANSLALDASGSLFVAGQTRSTGFPTTPGAFDQTYGGTSQPWGGDIFVSRFDPDLTVLEASTYLGGQAMEFNGYLTLDGGGNPCVAGTTASTDFPTTAGAFQEHHSGSIGGYHVDIFISRLDRDLTALMDSTYLGGTLDDWGYAPPVFDDAGNVYVTGHTSSENYPTTAGAYDTTFNGLPGVDVGDDVPLSKLDGGLTTLLASTFVGGSQWDGALAMARDGEGNLYVAGVAASKDYPVTEGAYDGDYNGGPEDAFVSALTGDLAELKASTYLGGGNRDRALSLALDPGGPVYVVGTTLSPTFPTTPDALDEHYNGGSGYDGDFFVSKLDAGLSLDPLKVDVSKISAASGGTAGFDLAAGPANGSRPYLLLGGMSGTVPGLPLPGGETTLPVNWDHFSMVAYGLANSSFLVDFKGVLDGAGKAKAKLDTQGPIDPACVGIKLCFAFALSGLPWDFASNPVKVRIVN